MGFKSGDGSLVNEKNGGLVVLAAVADNGMIGLDGGMPRYMRKELEKFRERTLNHGVVMGRVTAQSLWNSFDFPLNHRFNIVISKTNYNFLDNAISTDNLEIGLKKAMKYNPDGIGYVIGGGQIYASTIMLPETQRLEIIRVHQTPKGDTFFPLIDENIWEMGAHKYHPNKKYSTEIWLRK